MLCTLQALSTSHAEVNVPAGGEGQVVQAVSNLLKPPLVHHDGQGCRTQRHVMMMDFKEEWSYDTATQSTALIFPACNWTVETH